MGNDRPAFTACSSIRRSCTPAGSRIVADFLFGVWPRAQLDRGSIIEESVQDIRAKVGRKMVCALGGGVDSSVTAAILNRAIGDNHLHLRGHRAHA